MRSVWWCLVCGLGFACESTRVVDPVPPPGQDVPLLESAPHAPADPADAARADADLADADRADADLADADRADAGPDDADGFADE